MFIFVSIYIFFRKIYIIRNYSLKTLEMLIKIMEIIEKYEILYAISNIRAILARLAYYRINDCYQYHVIIIS